MGSGVEVEQAVLADRKVIACKIDKKYYDIAEKRCCDISVQEDFFTDLN